MKQKTTKHFSLHQKKQQASITSKKLKQITQQIHKKSQENIKNFNELEQQKRISQAVMKNISTSYLKIEDQAQLYSVKLEEERQKNKKLKSIINFCQRSIKSTNISPLHTPIFQEQIEYREPLIQQYKIKHNKIQAEILKKTQEINNHRKYRTISSNIFDQLQNQLFSLCFYYRQILIQKVKCEDIERIQTKKLNKLRQLDQSNQTNQKKEFSEVSVVNSKQDYQNGLKHISRVEKHFKEMNTRNKTDRHNKTNRLLKKLSAFKKQSLVTQLIHKTQIQRLVKEIFNDLQVRGIQELRGISQETLQKSNEQLFNQILLLDQHIYELQNKTKKLKHPINHRNEKKKSSNIIQIKKQSLQTLDEKLYINQEEVSNFLEQVRTIFYENSANQENVAQLMQNINNKICQYTYYDIKRQQSGRKQQELKKQLDKLLNSQKKQKSVKKTSLYTSKDLLEIGQKVLTKQRSSITLKKSYKKIDFIKN